MNYQEDVATAANYLKKSIPYIVANKTPANPINYALWYNYVANNIPELNQQIDDIIRRSNGVTPEQSLSLYLQFVINDHVKNSERTLKDITQIATKLLRNLNSSMSGTETVNQQLNTSIAEMKEATSMEQISSIVDSIISTTESIKSANQHYIAEMKSSTDEIATLKHQLEGAERKASVDQLTQLYNRHSFDTQLSQLTKNETVANSVCLILADLDHFKSFNDNYGHVIGDRVLRRMGELIQDYSPDNAIGARYGGEEFAVILSNSSIEQAVSVAETIRGKLQEVRVKLKNSDKVLNNISSSFGVARFEMGESLETFIDRTDQALYRAKENGRNRVEIF